MGVLRPAEEPDPDEKYRLISILSVEDRFNRLMINK